MYLQKLTDLVCTEKNIEKDLKEIRFGCKLKVNRYNLIYDCIDVYDIVACDIVFDNKDIFSINGNRLSKQVEKTFNGKISIKEIIGNPLEERHLRMYCKNKGIKNIFTNTDGKIFNGGNGIAICELDNKKPLSQQSEEVLKNIFEALAS